MILNQNNKKKNQNKKYKQKNKKKIKNQKMINQRKRRKKINKNQKRRCSQLKDSYKMMKRCFIQQLMTNKHKNSNKIIIKLNYR